MPVREVHAGAPGVPDVPGVVVTIDAVDQDQARSGQVAERLNRLARVATELQAVGNLEGLTNIVVSHMADAAGATTASLSVLRDENTLALLGLRGGTPGASSKWATYAVSDPNPAAATVRSGKPLVLAGRSAIEAQFPDIELSAPGER